MFMYKYMLYSMLILSSLISISSSSWLTAWMGLEMNLLSIIPLMKSNKYFSSETMTKYFMIQAISSMILLFSLITMVNLKDFNLINNFLTPMSFLSTSALLLKMGASPFHFWLPEVVSGLNWKNTYIILTWQKLAPMILLMSIKFNLMYMSSIIILCSMTGSILMLNQICLKKLLSYSSINHMAWMFSSMLNSYSNWLMYFIIYCMMNLIIMYFLNKFNIYHIVQLTKMFSENKNLKILFLINFMSLGGLPPFLGFLPKWITVNQLINNKFYFITLMLILFSLLTLYIYLRLSFSSWTLLTSEIFISYSPSMNSMITMMFISLLSLLLYPMIFLIN
uniref:NADH dehydrogenase subunit 2 n=1 Tax=Hylurgus ligniperda TaxID=167147 RepID=UPI0027AAC814|nr:NADH dehydrogenase subunit 2 [Hylurgus ligniperda]WGL40344.1 NADH dehydrogenase subunit 2 [Hylurgus ligniperda]WKD83323.1 NADH dehydrogenase subunit 2 [Hylurgus ligniperda]